MATWTFFKSAKKKLLRAGFNFSGNSFLVSLHVSGTPLSAGHDLTTLASVSAVAAQLASVNGYVKGGKTASGTAVTYSGNNAVFSRKGVCWSAVTGNLGSTASLKYAVLRLSTAAKSGFPICFATLSTAGFAVAATNALKINGGGGSSAKYFALV